jgi:hypothetical protein
MFFSNGNQQIYSDTEHIYYNARIDNLLDGVDNGASTECVYNKQSQNILERQSDYELAVQSWSIRADLPVFIATIRQGTNADINAMPYSVCYSFTTGGVTTNFQTDLIWVPDPVHLTGNPLPEAPVNNNGIQDLKTAPTYYWNNTYQHFVDIINTALKTSYDAFNAAHAGIHAEECWVQYDCRTGLFGIVAPTSYATGANPARVYLDALLFKYIDTINTQFHGYNQANGKDFQIDFQLRKGNSNAWTLGNHYAGPPTNTQTTPPDYIILEQECDSRFLWSNIKQILITSSSINMRNEYMPFIEFPQSLNQQRTIPNPNRQPGQPATSLINDSVFNLNRKSVISYIDYNYASPSVSVQSSLHRDIFYRPEYYKWIDLIGDSPLNHLNIEMFYQTEDGFILPLRIPNKASVNLKMVFRRKNNVE